MKTLSGDVSNLLVGRKAERQELLDAAAARQSALVVVYGRRRIGKTFLVRQTFENRFAFQCTGLARENRRRQLENFRDALKEAGARDCQPLDDWFAAFATLRDLLKNLPSGKKTVFLDEMPWMDTPKSHFVSALEGFWNGWASARSDIVLVVCGSATSWLVRKVFKDKGGLHDRVTHTIRLLPFTLGECRMLAESSGIVWTNRQIAEFYMAMGGVPWYWSLVKPGWSVAQAVEELCFAGRAPLRGEFDRLYAALFADETDCRRIVEALAGRRGGLLRSELLERLGGKSGGGFSDRLDDLEQCGFVRRVPGFGNRAKDSLYQLIDPFTLFHMKFLRDSASELSGSWLGGAGTSRRSAWEGLAFEIACLHHIEQIRIALGISGVQTRAFSWTHRGTGGRGGAQIDLLLDRRDGIVNMCEMKFSDGLYAIGKAEEEAVMRRRDVFIGETGMRKAVHVTFVTPNGVARNAHASIVQSEVMLEDLFR